MNLQELYDRLTPILMEFNETNQATDTKEVTIHATNTILNYFMHALQRMVLDGDHRILVRLGVMLGLMVPHIEKNK